MIVVEGCDGTGKTGLCQRLAKDLKIPILPKAVSSDAQYLEPIDYWVERHNALGFQPVIMDRHQLISHLIYGPTMRRKLQNKFQDLVWLSHQLSQFWLTDPFLIMCLPSIQVVRENMEMDEYKVAQDDIEVFYWHYHSWTAMNAHHVDRIWNYPEESSTSYKELINDITQRIEGHAKQ